MQAAARCDRAGHGHSRSRHRCTAHASDREAHHVRTRAEKSGRRLVGKVQRRRRGCAIVERDVAIRRVDRNRARSIRDRDTRARGQRCVDEGGAVSDQDLTIRRHRHEVGHRGHATACATIAARCAQSPSRGRSRGFFAVAVGVRNVGVAVIRDEIQLVVGLADLPAPPRIETARLGKLLAQLVDFASAREAREFVGHDFLDRVREHRRRVFDARLGLRQQVRVLRALRHQHRVFRGGRRLQIARHRVELCAQLRARLGLRVECASGHELLEFRANRGLDLFEVALDLRREVIAQLRQRFDQLLELGALNYSQVDEAVDLGLRVDHVDLESSLIGPPTTQASQVRFAAHLKSKNSQ